ncbi:MAG: hypothetical protein QOD07_1686 [Frankiaceae bacterium]|jgi:hypothetical protein|nr:hypothetical protein [Frankiaceae bacterium]
MSARLGRWLVAGTVVCLAVPFGAGVAFAVPAAPPVSGDARATAYPGNIHDGKAGSACSQLGFPNDTEIGADNNGSDSGHDVTVTNDGTYLSVSWLSTSQVDVIAVKGGPAYNVYPASVFTTSPTTGLHSPMVGVNHDNVPTISHWFGCAGDPSQTPPVTTVPTTGDVTGTCAKATVTVDAGTSDADVEIDPAGTGTAQEVTVPAGHESVVDVAVDAAHPTVTATDKATSNQLGTYTRSGSCGSSQQGAVDPKVSFTTSCARGIGVVLSNMKLDDTTTDDVTFTVTTPAGATQHVTVTADHIVKRYYPVGEDTTGVVTVAAPGLSTTSKSYAKNCTHVLGEKVTRTPKTPKVLGEKVSRLPFTGLPAWEMTALAAGMCLVGAACTRAGRRRPAAVLMQGARPLLPRRTYPSRGVQGR